jgi:hypothetical protein
MTCVDKKNWAKEESILLTVVLFLNLILLKTGLWFPSSVVKRIYYNWKSVNYASER